MRTVYFITGNLSYGGAPKILINVANYLSAYYRVKIINFGYNENFYKMNPSIEFVDTIVERPHNIIKKISNVFFRFIKIYKMVLKDKPAVIIAFDNTEKLFATVISKIASTKSIVCERKDPFSYSKGKKNVMYWRYDNADGCIFQTQGAADYFSEKTKSHYTVIPNFIEKVNMPSLTWVERNNEIAFVGRFDISAKRQDIMLKAFKIVSEQYPELKLVFYGGGNGIGEDMNAIVNLTKELKLEDKVVFKGVVSNIQSYLRKSKMFVITSAYEGIPNALLEAMACGLPVISTDCSPGGARFLINDGFNGKLVPIDDVDAIASAIELYLKNPDLADQYGKQARLDMNAYEPEVILPRWNEYIEEVINA